MKAPGGGLRFSHADLTSPAPLSPEKPPSSARTSVRGRGGSSLCLSGSLLPATSSLLPPLPRATPRGENSVSRGRGGSGGVRSARENHPVHDGTAEPRQVTPP